MRLLTLKFQNLNSLKGEWFIDFRDPAYADEGIFAITGATGAGKSTILDAICLALYGATPRLGDITQTKNDLMSRHTGECFAEVVFATQAGTFLCSWGQKRAHKKPDGKLQSPKHEIATFIGDHEKGQLLEEKANRTKLKVESITGMDFARFTRAMLLAQGSFSAFLQANSDERSPILEQITGTEIYSDISKKVHEIKRNQETELTTLKAQLGGMNLLEPSQEAELIEQQTTLTQTLHQVKDTIVNLEQALHWRTTLDNYQQEREQLIVSQSQLDEQITVFAPQQQRLNRALKAEQLKADYQQLNYLRQQLADNTQAITQLNEKRPQLETACQLATTEQQRQHDAYQAIEADWQSKQPLFRQVRQLDMTLQQQREQQQHLTTTLQQWQHKQHDNQQHVTEQQQALVELEHTLANLTQTQLEQAHCDNLPQTLATLQPLTADFTRLSEQRQQLAQSIDDSQTYKAQLQQQLTQVTTALTDISTQLDNHTQQQDALQTEFTTVSQGQSLAKLQQQAQQYWQRQTQLQTMQDWQQQLVSNLVTLQQLQTEKIQLQQLLSDQQQTQTHTQALVTQLTKQVKLLEQNLLLLSKIKDLETERQHLIDGEPCPLCGATEHPYATHTPAPVDEAQTALVETRQQLTVQQNQHQAVLLAINSLTKDLTQLEQQTQQLIDNSQHLTQQLHSTAESLQLAEILLLLNDLPVDLQHHDYTVAATKLAQCDELLTQQYTDSAQYTDSLNQRLTALNALSAQLQTGEQQFKTLNEQHNQRLHQQTEINSQLNHLQQRLTDFDKLLTDNQNRQSQLHEQLGQLFAPFTAEQTISFSSLTDLNQAILGLEMRWQDYQQLTKQLTQLDEQRHQIQQRLAMLTSEQQHINHQQQQAEQQLTQLQQQLMQRQNERTALFGNDNPDSVEQQLHHNKQQAFDQWQASQHKVNELHKQHEVLLSQIHQMTTAQTHLAKTLAQFEPTLQQHFSALGFSNEQDYRHACLSDNERNQLQHQADTLTQQQRLHHDRLTTLTTQINAVQQQSLSPLTAIELTQQLSEQKDASSAQQRTLGAIEQQLSSNAARKQQQQGLVAQIETQAQTLDEWQQLHELIGSSDGKKFRNFAQGLTFNIMISHANEQLKKMSDRYLLLADTEQPLMLNVMDNYQGGQIRTSKNLSGGESFIISLALALGLSNMASHRMQVDSLFLDEGFGTLDEEALDVALDTLTNLQQGGKLIGVISHIQALKDRIPSQIRVVPQTGGVSKIIGQGVQKLS